MTDYIGTVGTTIPLPDGGKATKQIAYVRCPNSFPSTFNCNFKLSSFYSYTLQVGDLAEAVVQSISQPAGVYEIVG